MTKTKQKKMPKLRFPGFRDEWEEKKLQEVSKLTSSKRVYLSDYVEVGVPFYRGKEISELRQGKNPKDILYISEDAYKEFKNKFGAPKMNEILITAVGTLGNVLRIRNESPFYFKDGNLIWLQDIKENPYFLEIILQRSKRELLKSSIGSSQQALTIVGLNNVKLRLPYYKEQEKIASFLGVVDEKIDLLSKKKNQLEKYKKGLMQKIFSQKIRFKDENGQDYPQWQSKNLDLLTKIKTGKKDANIARPNGQYRFYTCSRDYLLTDVYSFDGEAILVAGNAEVGLCHYYNGKFEAYQRTYVLQDFAIDGSFLYRYLSHYFRQYALSLMQTSAMTYITLKTLQSFNVPIPSTEEQKAIADFLSGIDEKIEAEERKLEKAKEFKKALLQQMFV